MKGTTDREAHRWTLIENFVRIRALYSLWFHLYRSDTKFHQVFV